MDWHSLAWRDLEIMGATLALLATASGFAAPRLWALLGAARDAETAGRERAALRVDVDAHEGRLDALERQAARLDERGESLRREINGRIDLVLDELRSERASVARRWRSAEARLLRAVRGLRATHGRPEPPA